MKRILFSLSAGIAAAIVALAPNCVSAQQALTWDQVKARFEAGNPVLRADADSVDEMRAEEITAYLRPNPQLTTTVDGTQIAPNDGHWVPLAGTFVSPNLSYLHERDHKRELRRESAQEGTRISASQHEDLKRNLEFTLRTAFVQTLEAKTVVAPGKLFREPAMGPVVFRHEQHARGLLVQTVDNARSLDAAHAAESAGTMREQRMHERVLARAHARMHHHAGGFVDRQQMLVLIQYVEGDRNRLQFGRHKFRQGKLDPVARLHLVAFANGHPIALHEAGLEGALQRRPAMRGKGLRQHLVGARPADLHWHNVRTRLQSRRP